MALYSSSAKETINATKLAIVLANDEMDLAYLVEFAGWLNNWFEHIGWQEEVEYVISGFKADEIKAPKSREGKIHIIGGANRGRKTAFLKGMLYALNVCKSDRIVVLDPGQNFAYENVLSMLHEALLTKTSATGVRKRSYSTPGSCQSGLERRAVIKSALNTGIHDEIVGPLVFSASALAGVNLFRYLSQPDDLFEELVSLITSRGGIIITREVEQAQINKDWIKLAKAELGRIWRERTAIYRYQPRRKLTAYTFGILIVTAFSVLLLQTAGMSILAGIIITLAAALSIQGAFTLGWMIYAWQHNSINKEFATPQEYIEPKLSFSAIIPARHEEEVIAETIRTAANINYPNELMEIIVVCREDDTGTIAKAREAKSFLPGKNIAIKTFTDGPINKPQGLNVALGDAKGEVVVIFDAEDQVAPDIYLAMNTLMTNNEVEVVQSGVQLMNYQTRWYSALNVLEYYFWFKSGLPFLAKMAQAIPLGGNTVFFKREWLEMLEGWDAGCLTEDADVGMRVSALGARIAVTYDENLVTREETPTTVSDFIRQRSRWNQGFLQIFLKGEWRSLATVKQRLLARYILLWPFAQAALAIYTVAALIGATWISLPAAWSLFSFLPMYMMVVQMAMQVTALSEFMQKYDQKISWLVLIKAGLVFIPYQFLLGWSAIRAMARSFKGQAAWEKTTHFNSHRVVANEAELNPNFAYEKLI